MSHFTVLVVGPNVDEQLHEFECTGKDNQYVIDIDETEEAKQSYESHKGEVIKVIDRTNQNKKWDWYQIGGRWTGFFKLNSQVSAATKLGEPSMLTKSAPDYKAPGSNYADQCLKSDIDFEAMRQESAAKAAKSFDLFTSLTSQYPLITPWKTILDKHGNDGIEAARAEYWDQPAIKALSTNKDASWFDLEDFLDITREDFIQHARDRAISTFAVIKDGQWYERGKMGWWGLVSDEKEDDTWSIEFSKLLNELPNDTLLTVVDCHI